MLAVLASGFVLGLAFSTLPMIFLLQRLSEFAAVESVLPTEELPADIGVGLL